MAEIECSANQYIYPYIIPSKAYPRVSLMQMKFKPACADFTRNFAPLFAIDSPYRRLLGFSDRPRLFVICGQGGSIPVARFVQVKDHINNSVNSETQQELNNWSKVTSDFLGEGAPHVYIAIVDVEIEKEEKEGLTIINKHQVKSFVENLRSVLPDEVFSDIIMCIKTTGCDFPSISRQRVIEHSLKAMYGDDNDLASEFRFRTFLQEEKCLPQKVSRQLEKSLITSVIPVFNYLKEDVRNLQHARTCMIDINGYTEGKISSEGQLKSIDNLLHLNKDLMKHLATDTVASSSQKTLLSFLLSSTEKDLMEKDSSHLFRLSQTLSSFNVNQMTRETATMEFIKILSGDEFKACLTEIKEGISKGLQIFRNGISQLESVFDTLLSRLKEEIPLEIQIVFARYDQVRMVTKREGFYDVFIKESEYGKLTWLKEELEYALKGLHEGVPDLHFKKFKGESSIRRFLRSGDKIGHYNPVTEKYNFGTVGAIGILYNFMEKFAFTCEHVAPANSLIFQSDDFEIGRSDKEFCIQPHEQYLGTMLDFSAVRLFNTIKVASFKVKDTKGISYHHKVYEGSLEKLVGKELFFYGATSDAPKQVKYIGQEACIKEEPHRQFSNNEEEEEDARRVLLLQGEGVVPGDSGSLVCYKDDETGDVYSVFIIIGGDTQSEDLLCCRLADCLDCIQERTGHIFYFCDTNDP